MLPSRRDGPCQPALTQRVKELAERYDTPLPQLIGQVAETGSEGERTPGEDGFRMEVKPGYKQTEVGVIPEDWEVEPLSSIASLTNGKAHERRISDFGNIHRC